MKSTQYQPKTGQKCHCRPGQARDNCPDCEGTGWRIDFKAIRERHVTTLFSEVLRLGIPYASHETDLYMPVTDQTRKLLKRFPTSDSNKTTFTNQVEGGLWFDVPFMYLPAWDAKGQP